MKRQLRLGWTCCNHCHTAHRTRATAWLHWLWIRLQECSHKFYAFPAQRTLQVRCKRCDWDDRVRMPVGVAVPHHMRYLGREIPVLPSDPIKTPAPIRRRAWPFMSNPDRT